MFIGASCAKRSRSFITFVPGPSGSCLTNTTTLILSFHPTLDLSNLTDYRFNQNPPWWIIFCDTSQYTTQMFIMQKNPDCGLFLKLALPCFCVFILIRYQVWFHSPNDNGTFCPYTKLHVMQIVKFILLWRGDVVIAASKFFIYGKKLLLFETATIMPESFVPCGWESIKAGTIGKTLPRWKKEVSG